MTKTALFDAKTFLKTVSHSPGIYQMFNAAGDLIYVGKARDLKKRLSSYFRKTEQSPKTHVLLQHIATIESTVTQNENDALLLEYNLIKKHKPRYNILLRDDKSYPYIYLSMQDDFPRLDVYRGKATGQGKYFGPYPNVGAVRNSLQLLQKLFRIRQCTETFFASRTRPCLQYQIKRCTAPCVGYIDKDTYQEAVQHAVFFLEGKSDTIVTDVAKKMEAASAAKQFELAAQYRDQIKELRAVQQQQFVTESQGDIDVIALSEEHGAICVSVLTIRKGRMLGSRNYFPKIPARNDADEVLMAFVSQYYLNIVREQQIPQHIIVNRKLRDTEWMSRFLTEKSQHKVNIVTEVRAKRAEWLKMAMANAEHALTQHLSTKANMYHRFEALKTALNLAALPHRLECFDISHSTGEATVASCVVFNREGPLKSDYRRFNIKGITPGDDYAALQQALIRHFSHLKSLDDKLPDVLFIDGGKGQIHQAEIALEECQVSGVIIVGVSKGPARKSGDEKIILAADKKQLNVASHSLAFHLIQQIRDEAHRFAITGHRKQRDKKRVVSSLEVIEGVGAKRRQELLRYFGGIQELKNASVKEIAKVPGVSLKLAEVIYTSLRA